MDEPIANAFPPDLENFRLEPRRQSVTETIGKTLFVESLEIDVDFFAIGSTIVNMAWRDVFVRVLEGGYFKGRKSVFSTGAVERSKCQHTTFEKE